MVRDTRARVGLVCIVLLGVACPGAAGPSAADRSLVQHMIAKEERLHPIEIDATFRYVLPPGRVRNVVPLTKVPAEPVLRFSIGFAPVEEAAAVNFEVLLRSAAGMRTVLYGREIDAAGWHDESVDLRGHDLKGARLVFHKSVAKGKIDNLWKGYWGEPILHSARPARRPSVLLVSIDTLRADLLAGHGRPASTPALDALAASGLSYTQAYSPSTWTFPSHYSLFRGVFPGTLPSGPGVAPGTLPEERPVALAEILRERGYLTAGFTGGGFVSPVFAFAEGFDVYYSFPKSHRPEDGCPADRFDGPETFRRAEQWLRAHRRQPFFLFVHTYDAHDRCRYLVRDWRGRLRDLDASKRDELIAHYRTKIEDSDRLLGGLLGVLAELGLEQDTLVVVTSDHGEALWEHGEAGHGCDNKPYEELIRVPLVLRRPDKLAAGHRIDAPVSLVGFAPTVLGLLGLPVPASMRDVAPLPLDAAAAEKDAPVYAHCGDLLAVRAGAHKLITSGRKAFVPELYDLGKDPAERTSLRDAAATAALAKLADGYWESYRKLPTPEAAPQQLDDATRQRLRALGYDE